MNLIMHMLPPSTQHECTLVFREAEMDNTSWSLCASTVNVTGLGCNSTASDDDPCALRPVPSFVPPAIDYVQAAIMLVVMTASASINTAFVYLVLRHKELRQRAFFLAMELVAINLVYTVTVQPMIIVGAIAREWVLGYAMCHIIAGISGAFFVAQFLMLLVLALDRAFTVFMPFYYERHGSKIALGMSVAMWTVSLSRPVSEAALGCVTFVPTYKICASTGSCNSICSVYVPVFAWIVTVPGIVAPLVLYVAMYLKGRQLNQQVKENSKSAFNKRIFKTFFILLIAIIGVALTAFILFTWFLISTTITIEFYVIQVLVGRTLSNSITIAVPAILLRNQDVRDAWNSKDRLKA